MKNSLFLLMMFFNVCLFSMEKKQKLVWRPKLQQKSSGIEEKGKEKEKEKEADDQEHTARQEVAIAGGVLKNNFYRAHDWLEGLHANLKSSSIKNSFKVEGFVENYIFNAFDQKSDQEISQFLNTALTFLEDDVLRNTTRFKLLERVVPACARFIANKACRMARLDSLELRRIHYSGFPNLEYSTYSERCASLSNKEKVDFGSDYLGKKCEKACKWLDALGLCPEAAQLVASNLIEKNFVKTAKQHSKESTACAPSAICCFRDGSIAFGCTEQQIHVVQNFDEADKAINDCSRHYYVDHTKVRAIRSSPREDLIASFVRFDKSYIYRPPFIALYNNKGSFKDSLYMGHYKNRTSAVSFIDDNKLVFGFDDGLIRIWDIDTKKVIKRYSFNYPVKDLATSPDGKIVACVGNALQTIDCRMKSIGESSSYNSETSSVDYSPDGSRILATIKPCLTWKGGFFVQDVRKSESLCQYGLYSSPSEARYSPLGNNQFYILYDDGKTQVFDMGDGGEVAMHRLDSSNNATACAFSPDGGLLTVENKRGLFTKPVTTITKYTLSDANKALNKKVADPAEALVIGYMTKVKEQKKGKEISLNHRLAGRLFSDEIKKVFELEH